MKKYFLLVFWTLILANGSPQSSANGGRLVSQQLLEISEQIQTQFSNVKLNQSIGGLDDEEMSHKKHQEWKFKKSIKGYEIMSSQLNVNTEILEKTKEVKIEILTGSARTVELIKVRRNVEIKISTWNKTNRVKVRVPFGFQPEELKITEKPSKIVIYAPYDFIEFPKMLSSEPTVATTVV